MRATSRTEQQELRAAVRRFMTEKASLEAARRSTEDEVGYDPDVWSRMAGELGLPGMPIPERYGGGGCTDVELGVVFEEMGRALYSGPYFATVALATNALLACDDEEARAEYLPRIADGSLLATLAVSEEDGRWGLDAVSTEARRADDGYRLHGVKMFVVDGHVADLLFVVARSAAGIGLYAVDAGAPGLTVRPSAVVDPTRRLARLELEEVPARPVGIGGDAESALSCALDRALVALAAEQAGVARRCLEMAVEYAKTREQFGRPIGSFQAIKHKCADMLLLVESAGSAASYAAMAAAQDPGELPVAAALAKAYCSEAAFRVAADTIQIHGGIGYTWEHDAHLYFRRAKSAELLFGTPDEHRDRLARLAEM